MKKTTAILLGIICYLQIDAQVYLKPVITSESSPGACDASITVIPYGGTPPYSVEWYGEGTWHASSGFTANNLCSGVYNRITIFDANCFQFEAIIRISSNPANQTVLDTLIITNPTTGNNDGSVQIIFSNLPSGASTSWSGGGTFTAPSTYTNLGEGLYSYSVSGGGLFHFSIPLYNSQVLPCDPFQSDVYTTPVSSFLARSPDCSSVVPDSIINDSVPAYCNGTVVINNFGAIANDYYDLVFYEIDGGAAEVPVNDSTGQLDSSICRGPYSVYSYTVPENGNIFYNVSSVFIQDSLDVTDYWNVPDTIPVNTDTVVMDALNIPAINYASPADTVFVSETRNLGAGQYEIVTCLIQQPDTFYMYTTEYLDTSLKYFLDITFFEGDSLLCDVNNAMRHVIYFEWPVEEEPCMDSILICHIPPGYPENAHAIMVPCDDLQNHLDHGDVIGECDRKVQFASDKSNSLQLYPNPADEQFILKSTSTIQRIELFSFDGKQILTLVVNGTNAVVDAKDLFPSTYFVKIHYLDGTSDYRKLVKMSMK